MPSEKRDVIGFGLADDGSKYQYAKLKFIEAFDSEFPNARSDLMKLRNFVGVNEIIEMGVDPTEVLHLIQNPDFAKSQPFSPEDTQILWAGNAEIQRISRSKWIPSWDFLDRGIQEWLTSYHLQHWKFMYDVALQTLVYNVCDALSSYSEVWHIGPWESHHPIGFTSLDFIADLTIETEQAARERLLQEAKAAIEAVITEAKSQFSPAPTKGNIDGIVWLVKYQVQGKSKNVIAQESSTERNYVARQINYWAEILGVQVRDNEKGGRPRKQPSPSL